VVKIVGFVGKPEYAKKTRGEQFFFVNQRFIKSNYLNHSVAKAYEELIARDVFPSFFLFLEVDPATIDINIHPTKTEIKFRDERHIYAILNAAIRRALGKFNISPTLDFTQEAALSFGGSTETIRTEKLEVSNWKTAGFAKQSIKNTWKELFELDAAKPAAELAQVDTPQQQIGFEEQKPAEHKAFQLQGKYIIAKMRSGFMVFDMLRARERVIYERAVKQLETGAGSSQQVLFPQNIDLNPADFQLIKSYEEELNALGFMFSEMGGNTLAVSGVPSEASDASPEQVLEHILEQIKTEAGQLKNERHEGMARIMARSLRGNATTQLSSAAIHELIDQLFACEMPYYTAAGKPTVLTWGVDELAERFG